MVGDKNVDSTGKAESRKKKKGQVENLRRELKKKNALRLLKRPKDPFFIV